MVACLACGNPSAQRSLNSTSTFGPPDLDLRPAELARSALWLQVQTCSSCGYCAPRIAEGDPAVATAVAHDDYRRLQQSSEYPDLARRFLASSWLSEVCNDDAAGGWAMLAAAWVCDDQSADTLAGICRNEAVRLFRSAEEEDENFAPDEASVHALIADILRRSRQFDDAEREYAAGLSVAVDDRVRAVLEFGQRLSERGDAEAHSLAELEL